MFKIIIQDQCGCFKKWFTKQFKVFLWEKDDAMLKAIEMKKTLWIELL